MNGGQLPTKLHNINWDALNHASRVPQLMSCTCTNQYKFVCVCVCVCVCGIKEALYLFLDLL